MRVVEAVLDAVRVAVLVLCARRERRAEGLAGRVGGGESEGRAVGLAPANGVGVGSAVAMEEGVGVKGWEKEREGRGVVEALPVAEAEGVGAAVPGEEEVGRGEALDVGLEREVREARAEGESVACSVRVRVVRPVEVGESEPRGVRVGSGVGVASAGVAVGKRGVKVGEMEGGGGGRGEGLVDPVVQQVAAVLALARAGAGAPRPGAGGPPRPPPKDAVPCTGAVGEGRVEAKGLGDSVQRVERVGRGAGVREGRAGLAVLGALGAALALSEGRGVEEVHKEAEPAPGVELPPPPEALAGNDDAVAPRVREAVAREEGLCVGRLGVRVPSPPVMLLHADMEGHGEGELMGVKESSVLARALGEGEEVGWGGREELGVPVDWEEGVASAVAMGDWEGEAETLGEEEWLVLRAAETLPRVEEVGVRVSCGDAVAVGHWDAAREGEGVSVAAEVLVAQLLLLPSWRGDAVRAMDTEGKKDPDAVALPVLVARGERVTASSPVGVPLEECVGEGVEEGQGEMDLEKEGEGEVEGEAVLRMLPVVQEDTRGDGEIDRLGRGEAVLEGLREGEGVKVGRWGEAVPSPVPVPESEGEGVGVEGRLGAAVAEAQGEEERAAEREGAAEAVLVWRAAVGVAMPVLRGVLVMEGEGVPSREGAVVALAGAAVGVRAEEAVRALPTPLVAEVNALGVPSALAEPAAADAVTVPLTLSAEGDRVVQAVLEACAVADASKGVPVPPPFSVRVPGMGLCVGSGVGEAAVEAVAGPEGEASKPVGVPGCMLQDGLALGLPGGRDCVGCGEKEASVVNDPCSVRVSTAVAVGSPALAVACSLPEGKAGEGVAEVLSAQLPVSADEGVARGEEESRGEAVARVALGEGGALSIAEALAPCAVAEGRVGVGEAAGEEEGSRVLDSCCEGLWSGVGEAEPLLN